MKTTKKQRLKRRNPPGGFTLLEILIAIFIFALVVSATFTAYTGTFKIIDETEGQEDIYRMVRIALERISEDLEAAYLSALPQTSGIDQPNTQTVLFTGEQKEINDRRCAELKFLSLAHLTFSDESPIAEPAEIVYYSAAGSEEGLLDLYRSDTPITSESPASGTGGLILCEGLSSVDFIYYDLDGEPHESWDADGASSKGKLPSRVSIVMEFPNRTDPERPLKFMTGVAIPMGG